VYVDWDGIRKVKIIDIDDDNYTLLSDGEKLVVSFQELKQIQKKLSLIV